MMVGWDIKNERNAVCGSYKNRVLTTLFGDEGRAYKETHTINVFELMILKKVGK